MFMQNVLMAPSNLRGEQSLALISKNISQTMNEFNQYVTFHKSIPNTDVHASIHQLFLYASNSMMLVHSSRWYSCSLMDTWLKKVSLVNNFLS